MNFSEHENAVIALHQHIASGACHQAATVLWKLVFAAPLNNASIDGNPGLFSSNLTEISSLSVEEHESLRTTACDDLSPSFFNASVTTLHFPPSAIEAGELSSDKTLLELMKRGEHNENSLTQRATSRISRTAGSHGTTALTR